MESRAHKIAKQEIQRSKDLLGSGWNHVSDEIRWGLVAANLLGVIVTQDALDSEDATESAKARVADFTVELWQAARPNP